MSMTDPIADMLTRIRNGIQAKHEKVDIPSSKLKENIAKVLSEEGYISGYKVIEDNKQNIIRIHLKYDDDTGVITKIRRVSKPGRRVYVKADKVPRVLRGFGVGVISTSKGVVSDQKAREEHIGGEFLLEVW